MNIESLSFKSPKGAIKVLKFLSCLGLFVFILGLFVNPERIWPNFLLSTFYLVGLGLGGLFFIALQYVTKAGWSVAFRRIPEAMTPILLVSAILMIAVMCGMHSLYEWTHDDIVKQDSILKYKTWWLNTPGFIIRSALYFAVWIFLANRIVRTSRRQDQSTDIACTHANIRWSALFIVVFAVTFSMASFDWIMSLEPHWYSTIFGVYNFAGIVTNGLAVITILVIILRRLGPFQEIITEEHLHDLGKLIFTFSTFWMYIWFSQYILIWYANLPEETSYYLYRHSGSWGTLSIVNLTLNWIIPFLVLMPRKAKRSENVLLCICIILLLGRWLDLYLMILPTFTGDMPVMGIWETFPFMGALALFFLVCFGSLERSRLIPIHDPMLLESLHHKQ